MIGYILTPEQKDQVQGQFYSAYEFFNCVEDINGAWFLFLSIDDKIQITDSQWAWILELNEEEYVPPSPPLPPTE